MLENAKLIDCSRLVNLRFFFVINSSYPFTHANMIPLSAERLHERVKRFIYKIIHEGMFKT